MSNLPDHAPWLIHLGYPEGGFGAGYYVARAIPNVGVCVSRLIGHFYIQFFPWGGDDDTWTNGQATFEAPLAGHTRFSRYISNNARNPRHQTRIFPSLACKDDADLLTIKCLIEEGLAQLGDKLDVVHQEDHTDTAARKAVE